MLTAKINKLEKGDVKKFLISVVEQAIELHEAGSRDLFHGAITSKMQKAQMIFRVIQELINLKDAMPKTINEILNYKTPNSEHTFFELLNSQRNTSTFWKSHSNLINQLLKKMPNLKEIFSRAPQKPSLFSEVKIAYFP